MRDLLHEKSTTGIRLKRFGADLISALPSISRSSQLIFLCGANQKLMPPKPSARREAIKKFIEGLSQEYHVIYAEGVFHELQHFSGGKNLLDLEHKISVIADRILIVLESESAFCELGAFAHVSLRNKLIIINDSQHKSSNSFINTGPIAAAHEVSSPVIWYPMSPDGINKLDGIGATFPSLRSAIKDTQSKRLKNIKENLSELSTNKEIIYFVHDLVLMCGPASYSELIDILKFIFGKNKAYDNLSEILSIMRGAELVHAFGPEKARIYRTVEAAPFLKYKRDIQPLISSFRLYHLKTNPDRFKNA